MLNIIKMDFYRMLKSKSQYILWILLTVMLVLTTASMREEYKDPQASANNWETMQDGVEDTAENLGMYVTVPTEPGQKATLYDMFMQHAGESGSDFLSSFLPFSLQRQIFGADTLKTSEDSAGGGRIW